MAIKKKFGDYYWEELTGHRTSNKKEAYRVAKKVRNQGYNAKVEGIGGKYAVYFRKAKRR